MSAGSVPGSDVGGAHPGREQLEPWQLSATELGQRFRDGALTPIEALESCIARIEQVNPMLNAVVATRYGAARGEALEAGARIGAGDAPPLCGVPITIKEFLGVRGLPNTGGLAHRRAVVAERDATVVGRLRRAGAVVLGVTNAPEGGLWHETNNPVWGRTRNPHDPARTSGGSSGGEGAILAAGGSPLGIGSDTGGSVRIPAGFCGIASHKPTGGLVPATGHYPPAPGGVEDVPMVIGPMARSVADLRIALSVIAGPDGVDPQCRAREALPVPLRSSSGGPGEAGAVDWGAVTVYAVPTNGRFRPDPEVEATVHKVAAALEARGARLRDWDGPGLAAAFEAWAALMAEIGGTYREIVAPHRSMVLPLRGSLLMEALRWPAGRSQHTGGVLAILALEAALGLAPGRAERAAAARELRVAFDRAVRPNGLVIHPVYPRTAPRHRAIAARNPLDVGCTTLFNVTESPVTVVRAGTDPRGMPIGVQIAGARGADLLTLAAAEAVEAVLGAPAPIDPRVVFGASGLRSWSSHSWSSHSWSSHSWSSSVAR
jgi:fatty acid amide hydrolase 2